MGARLAIRCARYGLCISTLRVWLAAEIRRGRSGGMMDHVDDSFALDARLAELRRREHGFPRRNQPFAALAEAIVWCSKVPVEAMVLEASAGSRREMADVAQDEERLRTGELERARASALDLENGL